ncbi:unannotated protein [freshwater metagenome]|uniref:Unannotated protein n=1 Tax=freshwater metagenome TaxID=449393 RepID=A0A6J7S4E2_9ZZZZ
MLLLLPAQPFISRYGFGALRLSFQPTINRPTKWFVTAQSQREGDVSEANLVFSQQLSQRAQPLQLAGTVLAVAGLGAGRLNQADALDVAQHSRRPTGRLRGFVDC